VFALRAGWGHQLQAMSVMFALLALGIRTFIVNILKLVPINGVFYIVQTTQYDVNQANLGRKDPLHGPLWPEVLVSSFRETIKRLIVTIGYG